MRKHKQQSQLGRSIWFRRARRLVVCGAVVILLLGGAVGVIGYTHPFPATSLVNWPKSVSVTDRHGRVLLEAVGVDDQWRIPIGLDEMSPWIVPATIAAEDERFTQHPGVDPVAVLRAGYQNARAGRVVSGASTLTMQLCRMLDERPRTLSAKLIEATRALQAERILSKNEILEHYLNVAPYGGNLRGVEVASKWYFGRRSADLSLSEASLLAGLPQSPSRYRPDRFLERARTRQVYVLTRMVEAGCITPRQQQQALNEPIQIVKRPAHTIATQVAWLAVSRRPGGGRTTIDLELQREMERRAADHAGQLPPHTDVAVVVIDIATSEIRALVGSADRNDPVDGQVNGVLAKRSPGSLLKPFLYAAGMEARRLNADTEIHDVPIERADWRPNNFDREFQGTMCVADALRRSRNVPAILVLEALGVSRCVGVLEAAGVTLSARSVADGGLSIAVGTAETTLLDVTNAYATLGRQGVRAVPRLFLDEPVVSSPALSRETCATLTEILSTRHRTPRGLETTTVDVLPWFMWKTGTSSGRRDAWAVGHNGKYAIGVWVGRFSGAGHSRFVGMEAAEPLLAELFTLPSLRNDVRPPIPALISIERPLELNRRSEAGPSISSPLANATYVGQGSLAIVPVRAQQTESACWFLNGRLYSDKQPKRLELPAGSYELRCVSADGRLARVHFVVQSGVAFVTRTD